MKSPFSTTSLRIGVFFNLLLILPLISYSQEWKRTQLGTGIGNCGPASAAMMVSYSKTSITVEQARAVIGYARADGATSFSEIYRILNYYQVPYTTLSSLDSYEGTGILLIVLQMRHIRNRPYEYAGGHYIIICGIEDYSYRVADPLAKDLQYYAISDVQRAQYGDIVYCNIGESF
jgi:hypothetical protein